MAALQLFRNATWNGLLKGCYVSGVGCLIEHIFPCFLLQEEDTVMLDLESGKIKDHVKFDLGNLAMVTGGHNNGRVGTIVHKEKHKGGHDIVHIEDAAGNRWAGNDGFYWVELLAGVQEGGEG
jgi:hypothetical protein